MHYKHVKRKLHTLEIKVVSERVSAKDNIWHALGATLVYITIVGLCMWLANMIGFTRTFPIMEFICFGGIGYYLGFRTGAE